ncbi:hypothetical protein TWF481_003549 [Arthrobotrys musiformis]|uniref:Uncharacterized protein n=1 Tax=Arthrobotrys musiformis TaxID=47236 RepID=A0AAV9WIX0_9PEZI
MPNSPNDGGSAALPGVLVVVLSLIVVALLALVCYLYFQLKKIHQQYIDLLQESGTTSALSRRIHEQRKSAIFHMATTDDLEQQRDQYVSSPVSQHSVYSMSTLEYGRAGLYPNDTPSIDTNPPATEPWAIRKVRSIERLTGLTNELSTKPDRRDPFFDPGNSEQYQNPFFDQAGTEDATKDDIEKDLNAPSASHDIKLAKIRPLKLRTTSTEGQEATKVEAGYQKVDNRQTHAQSSITDLLAVPQTICMPRNRPPRPTVISNQSESIWESESESNIPPHARSTTPISPLESSPTKSNDSYISNPDPETGNSPDLDNIEHYDADEVPCPFLERSFSLNLAYSDPETDISAKNRNSPRLKLKGYLKNARSNRRSLGSTQAQTISTDQLNAPGGTIPKAGRELFRLSKHNREHNSLRPEGPKEGVPDKLAIIEES